MFVFWYLEYALNDNSDNTIFIQHNFVEVVTFKNDTEAQKMWVREITVEKRFFTCPEMRNVLHNNNKNYYYIVKE
jgi:hypothetical protein